MAVLATRAVPLDPAATWHRNRPPGALSDRRLAANGIVMMPTLTICKVTLCKVNTLIIHVSSFVVTIRKKIL